MSCHYSRYIVVHTSHSECSKYKALLCQADLSFVLLWCRASVHWKMGACMLMDLVGADETTRRQLSLFHDVWYSQSSSCQPQLLIGLVLIHYERCIRVSSSACLEWRLLVWRTSKACKPYETTANVLL